MSEVVGSCPRCGASLTSGHGCSRAMSEVDIVERLREWHEWRRSLDIAIGGKAAHEKTLLVGAAADEIERLRVRIAEQEAEIALLREDSRRLDYIETHARCDPKMDGYHVWWPTTFNHRLVGPSLRAAIDAARKEQS